MAKTGTSPIPFALSTSPSLQGEPTLKPIPLPVAVALTETGGVADGVAPNGWHATPLVLRLLPRIPHDNSD
jgi:hypothetical protein